MIIIKNYHGIKNFPYMVGAWTQVMVKTVPIHAMQAIKSGPVRFTPVTNPGTH
jgi:hypothetical protein